MVTVRVSDPEYELEEPRESHFPEDGSFTALKSVFDISGLAADKAEELQALLLGRMYEESERSQADVPTSLSKLVNRPITVIVNHVNSETMDINDRRWQRLPRGYYFMPGVAEHDLKTEVVWVVRQVDVRH